MFDDFVKFEMIIYVTNRKFFAVFMIPVAICAKKRVVIRQQCLHTGYEIIT